MKEIALNILDIVQNSIRAEATRISVNLIENKPGDKLTLIISDDGNGMNPEFLKKASDPFVTTRTTRRTGFGLALLKFHSELTGGSFRIDSGIKKGTTVTASFKISHPDRQPFGDIAGVITMLMFSNPAISFEYFHITGNGTFSLSSRELRDTLGPDSLYDSSLIPDLKEYINNNLESIGSIEEER